MKKILKNILISVHGFLLGTLGFYWDLMGVAFMFPEYGPGSLSWEEDKIFIPIGIFMVLIWLAIFIFTIYKFRKSKAEIISFIMSLLFGITIFVLWWMFGVVI
ncbi:MAG: hypothetical protein IJX24_01255 [Oscillospiraceae bacterium]|nr:hypothetical protein [Oscillospiraceae bacterium]